MRVHRGLTAASGLSALLLVSASLSATHSTGGAGPTFTKDVAPILYRNCTSCHRSGEIGPMPLLTYDEARPYLKAIAEEVSTGHMPPWHADAPSGTFENERRLTDAEKQTILAWIQAGAPKGNPRDQPPHPAYADGWSIGKPDLVLQMQQDYWVPAQGKLDYAYFYIPTGFTETKYVQAIEVRPGNRSVVHHVLVSYHAAQEDTRPQVLRFNPEWQVRPHSEMTEASPGPAMMGARLIATYAPGTSPQVFRPGTALRLEPGGVLELQMHYTTTGRATPDRTRIGLVFSKDPPTREVRASSFFNATFVIPPGQNDVMVPAEVTFAEDATVFGLLPHTHLRGKRWEYTLLLPDGSSRLILSVPRYDFHWQTYYMFADPLQVPAGSKIRSVAWYDNSPANRANPEPRAEVRWGDQTWDEMQYSGILYSAGLPRR